MRAVAPLLVLLTVSAQAQDAPTGLSLPDLVGEALDHNPEVQVAAHTLEGKRARVPQAAALPDPMLMYGVINEGRPVPFQTLGGRDFSEAYVGVSQDMPFPGKRRLRKEAAQEEVEAAQWAYEAVRRRVSADVAEAYYDLYATHAAQDVVEESARLLEQLIKVAHVRLSVGQTSQQDALDAEVEMSRLEERRTELGTRRAILEERLRRLLSRRTAEPFGRPELIVPAALPGSLEALLARAEENSPALEEKARIVSQAERLTDLAARDRKPDFSVNFTYHNRGGLDPMYSLGGTVTLPNLPGRQEPGMTEAAANRGGARSAADVSRPEVRHAR